MKRFIMLSAALALFVSCAFAESPGSSDAVIEMTIGEETGDYYAEVELFYESANGMELVSVTRNIYVPEGGSIVECALDELFAAGEGEDFISSMPGDAYVKSVEVNCGIATVDLFVNMAGIRDESELVSMIMAVSNTLINLDGIEYVNVLINSRQEGIRGLPVGIRDHEIISTAMALSTFQGEKDYFLDSANVNISLTRNVALYFPSVNGQWLLPEIREISFEDTDYASALLLALMQGPDGGAAYSSFLSNGANILVESPGITISDSGERILEISLSGVIRDYMLLQGITDWQFAGAITLTMTSFIPEIDAVRIVIDGNAYSQMNIRGHYREFNDGLLRRSDFAMYTGSTCDLYFAAKDGGLCIVQRSMSAERAVSPFAILTQLISGPSAADTEAYKTMPAGITANDLLGVDVSGGVATVNMSANFYRLCQALDEEEEIALVYSIVNTLCELPEIRTVRIVIEGESIDNLSGHVCLLGVLFPNPGAVRDAEVEDERN